MKLIYTKDGEEAQKIIDEIISRGTQKLAEVSGQVSEIIEDVKKRGDEALRYYTKKFDGCDTEQIRVTPEETDRAFESCSARLLEVLSKARDNISAYHSKQLFSPVVTEEDGRRLSQIVLPLKRVGIYVPGGSYPYPSTVLMNAVPAKCAGVPEIVMITPPGKDGSVDRNILAAAKIAGVTEIYKAGGAQAVAALAYGTESIKSVDKICGPGNIYVTAAKKIVYGDVGIDMLAGPSEVLVIADKYADPEFIAADMLAQAEHDPKSAAILITNSEETAKAVIRETEIQLSLFPPDSIVHSSVRDYAAAIVCGSLDEAADISNRIAPEHLELNVRSYETLLEKITNAGSVFLGEYTPEPVGDYYAGTNHTLPTSGTARFCSPLSAYDFMRRMSVLHYEKEALAEAKDDIILFAQTEGLHAHAEAVRRRFREDE